MYIDNGNFLKVPALWMRGGADDESNRFTEGGNAWRTILPVFVPSMTKIIFTVPEGVRVRAVSCVKHADTGSVNLDYTFDIPATKWRMRNYEFYAGNDDAYVMLVVEYEDGRAFDFDAMPVTFYRPEREALPAYWLPSLERALSRIEENRQKIEEPVELFYLTDVHWIDNAQRSPVILNHLSQRLGIPHVVFGGDMIRRHNKSKVCGMREVAGFYNWLDPSLKVFTTLGNHDRNYSSGNTDRTLRFSEEESHELYMRGIEQFAVTEGDPSHGYYDYPEQKVRMVQFYLSDSMFGMPEDSYVDGALDWVEQRILELDEDWTVLLFTHAYSRGLDENGKPIITKKNLEIRDRLLDIKERAQADLAFWVTGHIHVDTLDYVTNGRTTLPIISVLSDGYLYATKLMRVGTDTEQAIDCMQIDKKNRTIHCTRIGSGEDREYRY